MRVLVTGAAGFIGSHVVRDFLERGWEVVGLDDLSTGHWRNLVPASTPGWKFLHGDVRTAWACDEAMRGVDAILHLAGRNSVPRSLADPRSAVDVNVMGGFQLLESARASGVRRVVFASSSSVYGDGPGLPRHERMGRHPISPYAATKACFEHLAQAWHRSWGMETIGLRFFNVFGPRQDPDSAYAAVVPRFVRAALEGRPAIIHGDGKQARDFTFVENVVLACRLAVETRSEAAGKVLNIACSSSTSILELHRLIFEAVGCRVPPEFTPPRAGDMPDSLADIDLARELLLYEPKVDVEEGIRRTVAWYRAYQPLEPDAAPQARRRPVVAVVGGVRASGAALQEAERIGRLLVDAGYRVATGGLGGTMEAVSRGARSSLRWREGDVVGVLPGLDAAEANTSVDISIPTGLSLARNAVLVGMADAVVAVAGGAGTLSEVAFAWQYGKPVVALDSGEGWASRLAGVALDERRSEPVERATTAEEVVTAVRRILEGRGS